jgi:hypothetical protein
VNGQPAAAATLYVHDRVGYLADSATDPSFRRRGLQVALVRRRMRDAGVSGADLIFSGAEPFSSSHRNMERRHAAAIRPGEVDASLVRDGYIL